MTNEIKRKALLSVSDKEGLAALGRALIEAGYELLSTGGTAKALRGAELKVTDVSEYTGSPEVMDGRVKTLHPRVHGGILMRDTPGDRGQLLELGGAPIDLVVVNLYPFEATVAKGAPHDEIVENIDIGGPAMLRSAAKNHARVAVVVDPADYAAVIAAYQTGDGPDSAFRARLAEKAFAHTAEYDKAIAKYLTKGSFDGLLGMKTLEAKYGECPSHASAFFAAGKHPLLASAFQLVAGSQPSHIGFTDVESAAYTLAQIAAGWNLNFGPTPKIAIGGKHGNVCGVGVSDDPAEAVRLMVQSDPTAIHGGTVLVNFDVTTELATLMRRHLLKENESSRLLDNVVAPSFDEGANEVLERKHGKCRMLVNPALLEVSAAMLPSSQYRAMRFGGFMRQDGAPFILDLKHAEMKTMGELTTQQKRDMVVAWAIGSTSVSNTITLMREGMLVANAVGQQSRVRAAELGVKIGKDNGHATVSIEREQRKRLGLEEFVQVEKEVYELLGCVGYSDSFFPFPDALLVLANAGVKVIFASNGSVNDKELVFPAAKEAGVNLWTLPDKICRGFARH